MTVESVSRARVPGTAGPLSLPARTSKPVSPLGTVRLTPTPASLALAAAREEPAPEDLYAGTRVGKPVETRDAEAGALPLVEGAGAVVQRSIEAAESPAYRGESVVGPDADERLLIDLWLTDPQNTALIDALGPSTVEVSTRLSQSLAERYGDQRFARLQLLQQAHEHVREAFTNAYRFALFSGGHLPLPADRVVAADAPLAAAVALAEAPGWKIVWQRTALDQAEAGYLSVDHATGAFDAQAFITDYVSRPGLLNRAFAQAYAPGPVPSDATLDAGRLPLAGGQWLLDTSSGELSHTGGLGAVHPESSLLANPDAIDIDPLLGIASPRANFRQDTELWDTVFDAAASAAIAYLAVQTGGAAAAAMELGGSTLAAGAVTGAVAGAVGAAFNGVRTESLSWATIAQAVLAGGVGGAIGNLPLDEAGTTLANLGLPSGPGDTDWGLRAASALGQSTLRGVLASVLGGRFENGFAQALAQFVAAEFTRGIDQFAASASLDAAQAAALRSFGQLAGSAIRAAATDGHALRAAALDWVGAWLNQNSSPPVAEAAGPPAWLERAEPAEPLTVPWSADGEDVVLVAANGGGLANIAAGAARAATAREPDPATSAADQNAQDSPLAAPGFYQRDLRNLPSPEDNSSTLPSAHHLAPALEPVTGFPVYSEVLTRPGIDPAESRRIGSVSEEQINERLAWQYRADRDPLVPDLDLRTQEELRAVNWIKLNRAQVMGLTEGNGFVFDEFGNVRTFNLARENTITAGPDETVRIAYSYVDPQGNARYVRDLGELPADAGRVITVRELYYKGRLNGRDFSVPEAYRNAIPATTILNGDLVDSIRRMVSVPTTGPLAELNRFIDPGSGQINPLLVSQFEDAAQRIVEQTGQPIQVVVTTNGMLNGYQQARSNGALLAAGIENSIVFSVLNPTTGSNVLDGLEAVAGRLGAQQSVISETARTIADGIALQSRLSAPHQSGDSIPDNLPERLRVLVVGHSQGTINATAALESATLRSRLGALNVMLLGSAVDRVPVGVNRMLNITDRRDPVSNQFTDGANAIRRTFTTYHPQPGGESPEEPLVPGQLPLILRMANGDEASINETERLYPWTRIPDNYRDVRTDFAGDQTSTGLPTGNYHSFSLYLMRPEVQRTMREFLLLRGADVRPPRSPLYTEELRWSLASR